MLRFRSNCSTRVVAPRRLVDVISVTPAMRPNCRSSGVATEDAIVSGLAPGRIACTEMTGTSTEGSEATGKSLYASAPTSSSATLRSEVATGRLMNGAAMFTGASSFRSLADPADGELAARARRTEAAGEAIERQVDDRGGVGGEGRRQQEAAHRRESAGGRQRP